MWEGEFWGAGVFLDRRGIDEQPYFGAYLVHLLKSVQKKRYIVLCLYEHEAGVGRREWSGAVITGGSSRPNAALAFQ